MALALEATFAHIKQGKEEGWVPLADFEVTPKSDPNYWAMREYVVWFASILRRKDDEKTNRCNRKAD